MDAPETIQTSSPPASKDIREIRRIAEQASIDFFPRAREAVEGLQPFNPNTPDPDAAHALASRRIPLYRPSVTLRPKPRRINRLLQPSPVLNNRNTTNYLGFLSTNDLIKQKQQDVVTAIEDSLTEEHLTFADLKPYRTRTCYRIVRYLMHILAVPDPMQSLSQLTSQAQGTTTQGTFQFSRRTIPKTYKEPSRTFLLTLNYHLKDFRLDPSGKLYHFPLFPPLPLMEKEQPIFSEYSPQVHEPVLVQWCRLIECIITNTSIGTPHYTNPNAARYGMTGISDPWLCRVAWPDWLELVQYENELITYVTKTIIRSEITAVIKNLVTDHGFSEDEARQLTDIARAGLATLVTNNETLNRNLMILRLENMWKRAKQEGSFKAETDALKMMATIQGLTSDIKDDFMTSFMQAAKRYTQSAVGSSSSQGGMELIDGEAIGLSTLNSIPSSTITDIASLPFYPKGVDVPPPAQTAGKPNENE